MPGFNLNIWQLAKRQQRWCEPTGSLGLGPIDERWLKHNETLYRIINLRRNTIPKRCYPYRLRGAIIDKTVWQMPLCHNSHSAMFLKPGGTIIGSRRRKQYILRCQASAQEPLMRPD